jgi:hypothetical protein
MKRLVQERKELPAAVSHTHTKPRGVQEACCNGALFSCVGSARHTLPLPRNLADPAALCHRPRNRKTVLENGFLGFWFPFVLVNFCFGKLTARRGVPNLYHEFLRLLHIFQSPSPSPFCCAPQEARGRQEGGGKNRHKMREQTQQLMLLLLLLSLVVESAAGSCDCIPDPGPAKAVVRYARRPRTALELEMLNLGQ